MILSEECFSVFLTEQFLPTSVFLVLFQEKELQKAKWLSEEALQIAMKRREAKGKEKRKDIPI